MHDFPPRLLILIAALGVSVPQVSAGGVTVITHGFNSDITSWILPMASRFPGHPGFPGTDLTCYEIEITASGGGFAATASRLDGPAPDASDSGEIVVKLDWSSIDTGQASTRQVAEAAALALLSTGLIPENDGRPLAELPLHLIGHSRGASVASEIARELGERGVWVDHLTCLDPVPVASYGDAPVEVWENVLYADNFYQRLNALFGLDPMGNPVAGAYNRKLLNLNGANASAHSDVHLWYHGTVELGNPASDSQQTITATIRSGWWTPAEAAGSSAGFRYGRIAGGDRLSDTEPAGTGNGRIHDGYNRLWDLGAGSAANRSLVPGKDPSWPSPITCRRIGSGPVPAGGAVDLELRYQSADPAAGEPVLTTVLDPDANPWNGNEIVIDTRAVPASGSALVFTRNLSPLLPAATPPGSYRLATRLHQAGRTRHLQAAGTLLVSAPPAPPAIDSSTLGFSGGLFSFTVLGSPGQVIRIEAATTLGSWQTIATRALDAATWIFSDPDSASFPKRFYRVVPGP